MKLKNQNLSNNGKNIKAGLGECFKQFGQMKLVPVTTKGRVYRSEEELKYLRDRADRIFKKAMDPQSKAKKTDWFISLAMIIATLSLVVVLLK
jgi:hypothetical protein